MVGQKVVDVEDPFAEVVATAGLLLMFVAVIGLVIGVTSFGVGGSVLAAISFVGSLACFVVDGKRLDAAR
jgi:hypothetical protein